MLWDSDRQAEIEGRLQAMSNVLKPILVFLESTDQRAMALRDPLSRIPDHMERLAADNHTLRKVAEGVAAEMNFLLDRSDATSRPILRPIKRGIE